MDWTNGITIDIMGKILTPKQAARVKYRALIFREMDPAGAEWFDQVTKDEIGHQWFCFCVDAVARREN